MAGRKRTRSENRETKTQESPMKNPPIVKVGLIIRPLCPGDNTLLRFRRIRFCQHFRMCKKVDDILFQAPNVSELGPSMERRTLMSNVQPAPLSYEDLANQVLLLLTIVESLDWNWIAERNVATSLLGGILTEYVKERESIDYSIKITTDMALSGEVLMPAKYWFAWFIL